MKKDKNMETEEQQEKMGFRQAFTTLPRSLQLVFFQRMAYCLLAAMATLLTVCISKDPVYCVGFLISLFSAYLGMDIIWKYAGGKLYTAKMVVCKAQREWRKSSNQYNVILRDASIENPAKEDSETAKFRLTVTRSDAGNITEGTVLQIYFFENAPRNVLAYDILG